MRCDEADLLLDAFAEDALDEPARSEVAAHVASCARCARELARARDLTSALARSTVAAPDAAVDARVFAALEEERRWIATCARARRGAGIAAVAAVVLSTVGLLVAKSPLAPWLVARAETALDAAMLWVRWRAVPALVGATGPLAALAVALVAIAVLERVLGAFSRSRDRHRDASA